MDEKELESKKDEEKVTPAQDDSSEKTNAAKSEEKTEEGEGEDEVVTISKKELETYKKKSEDFDGILEKRRLEKLEKKEEAKKSEEKKESLDVEAIIEKAKEEARAAAREALNAKNSENFSENLRDAYKQFLSENPWADSDEVFANISKNFKPSKDGDKSHILSTLEIAAQLSYPTEYKKYQEDKIKAKILSEERSIMAGEAGGTSTKDDTTKKPKYTPEQERLAKLCGNDPNVVYKD